MHSIKICRLVDEISRQFASLSDSAKIDAEVLICHVLCKPRSYLYTWPERDLSAEEVATLNALVKRRLNGEPIAYITGNKEFWSLPLDVSPATLIPRPDTEILIETVLGLGLSENSHVLDLGTGTGAIALALASENSSWSIDAVDFNDEAVELAMRNAKKLALNEQVNVFQSHWYTNIDTNKRYEIIVSNPPYIDELDAHLKEGDVVFEPKSALVADNNGMADIEHIIKYGRKVLADNGYLLLEHGYNQATAVQQCFDFFGFTCINTIQDYSGNDRVTFAQYNNTNCIKY